MTEEDKLEEGEADLETGALDRDEVEGEPVVWNEGADDER